MPHPLIVHPTDLSPTSEGAFHHALRLGVAARSRLALVHVHGREEERPAHLESFPHVRDTLAQWGLIPAGAPRGAVSQQLGLYVSKADVTARDAEGGLAHLLRDEDAEMLVLGTKALAGLQRLVEGSFSEKLARDARLPTLFIPAEARGFVDPQTGAVRLANVLIPVARAPDPARAVAAAQRLNALLGQDATFHLLHVGANGGAPQIGFDLGARRRDLLRSGPVVETICAVADELDADVIVMATAGHKGVLDALRGSTTEGVLRRAGRALLAAPAQA
jgi:nucleotide-binding universal stress UspA family protein